MLTPPGRRPDVLARWLIATVALLTLESGGPATRVHADAAASLQPPSSQATSDGDSLLARVRATLQEERKLLLEYTYREKRRPIKVSAFGKVTVGEAQVFDVFPSGDPDRPQRVLVEVAGRAATRAERDDYARRHPRDVPETADQRKAREEREAEIRRRAQERFEDVFRVLQFEPTGVETIDSVSARVIRISPRPGAEPRSDIGKWMKKFQGTAWIEEHNAQLIHLRLVATDTFSLGWGVVGRVAEGTTVTYTRRQAVEGRWFPAAARFEARGRTLLFRSFEVDMTTEWYDYRPYAATSASR